MMDLIKLTNLLDEAKCYEVIRQLRWPDGVVCLHCRGTAVVRNGHDDRERSRQRYLCKTCKHRFDDLTGTVLAGHHQPVSTWILGSYFMGVNLVWGFQCQAVSSSSLQCVHPYVRSEEPSLRPDHDPGQTPAGAEVKDGRQATAAGGASLRFAPAGVTLGGLGGGAQERTGSLVEVGCSKAKRSRLVGSAEDHAIRQTCMRSGGGRKP
jgi:hypothetical protein